MSSDDCRIENPNEPRHFARIARVSGSVEIRRAGRVLAKTRDALRLLEHGRDLYDPVFYVPRSDLFAEFKKREETTHCPLKGDAQYFDLVSANGDIEVEGIAWAYPQPLSFAQILENRVAFVQAKVTISEGDA